MPSRGPIVLTTDFGTADGFVGVMKGVILGINPSAQVVDLTHELPPQDVRGAAYVLWAAYRYFPLKSIFVGVVDPGVGGNRRGIAVETPRGTFVGPDNGIFSSILEEIKPSGISAVQITNLRYCLSAISATFHGRDVFAPVAAHLSLGVPMGALGPAVDDLVRLEFPRPTRTPDCVEGEVLRVDRFGNLITNLRLVDLDGLGNGSLGQDGLGEVVFEISGATVRGLRAYYSASSGIGAVVGSAGLVEIALTNGSAAATLGAVVGDKVSATCAQVQPR